MVVLSNDLICILGTIKQSDFNLTNQKQIYVEMQVRVKKRTTTKKNSTSIDRSGVNRVSDRPCSAGEKKTCDCSATLETCISLHISSSTKLHSCHYFSIIAKFCGTPGDLFNMNTSLHMHTHTHTHTCVFDSTPWTIYWWNLSNGLFQSDKKAEQCRREDNAGQGYGHILCSSAFFDCYEVLINDVFLHRGIERGNTGGSWKKLEHCKNSCSFFHNKNEQPSPESVLCLTL